MNKLLQVTSKYIDAYKKIGRKELIIEAEKCYVYEQYELALEICNEILLHQDIYPYDICVRAQEIQLLIFHYHSAALGEQYSRINYSGIYNRLSWLDERGWDIYDSRLILGHYYVSKAKYKEAANCYRIWAKYRNRNIGLNELTEMYKKGQYDTDTLYIELVEYYEEFYRGINVKDALIKSAKVAEEYFLYHIYESVFEKLGIQNSQPPKKTYSDKDFVLPYVIRNYDCADEIRYYARESQKPTLEGCMFFLSQPEVRLRIEKKTMMALDKEYKEALVRNHLQNEKSMIEIQRQDIQNRNRHYEELRKQMQEYNNESIKNQKDAIWYQKQVINNQKEAIEDGRKFRREVDYRLQKILWRI